MVSFSYTKQLAERLDNLASAQSPAPMATALPTTNCTVTNGTRYNVRIVFYDSTFNALTSQTNVSGQSNISIPVGSSWFDIYSGSAKVIANSPIKPKISYTVMQNGTSWTVLPSL